ncbi:uncharacterized protein LOC124159848 [Ischnura elegans]|uniref:uncharacterized protein LOC124159848 n=1 Tax=Ischnura elegans TaxID=197161 RepID=UPI001ED88A31|nr:uncharacterized protein LOC124159848 [Ischnura elegans]
MKMDFFTEDDLTATLMSAIMSPNFKILDHRFDKVYNFGSTKMGTHRRLVLEIEDSENDQHLLSFFAKFVPENEAHKAFAIANDCFGKEVYFYSHIASIMEPMLPYEMPLPIPMCHFARVGSTESNTSDSGLSFEASAIILQDLYHLGFVPMNMWIPLDLPYCRVVMRALAIFHGGSVLIQNSKGESSELAEVHEAIFSIKESVFIFDEDAPSGKILHGVVETTANLICQFWPQKYPKEQFYQRLLDILWNSFRNVGAMLQPSHDLLSVLCHGELCGNNILFAYEKDQEEQAPVDAKFVDMQLMRYSSPITDILTFLHVCTRRGFRNKHLPELLSYYQMEFSRAVSPKVATKTLSLEELQTCAKDMKEFGLVAAIHLIPVCLAQSPAQTTVSSFHFDDEDCHQIQDMLGRQSLPYRRDSLLEPLPEPLQKAYSMQENQSEIIFETMRANRKFRGRLEEAYIEYLEFVGLWESSSSE